MPKSLQTQGKRPVLDITYSQLEIMVELVSGIGILFTVIMLVIAWPQIPNTVPTHFGASGIADSWGSKLSLLLLPTIVIFLYVMLTVVSRFPHTFNYPWTITEENAEKQYRIGRNAINSLKTELVWLFTYMEWQSVQVSMGKATGLGTAFLPVSISIVFATLGCSLYKANKYR